MREAIVAVLDLLAAADVVDLAGLSRAQDELDPGAVILDVEPVAHLPPVAVEGERLAVECVRREERDQLLRVLVRPVRVRATRDRGVDPEGPHVGRDVEVARRLGDAVGARRPDRVVLAGRTSVGQVPVDLVGGDLDEARAGRPHVLEQHLGAEELGAPEVGGAEDRTVDVRLRGEVHDRRAAPPGRGNGSRIDDVALVELVLDALEVRPVARVGELVEHHDLVACCDEPLDEVGADEPGSAGDEDPHRPKA